MSVSWPAAIAGQPSRCGADGSPSVSANQSRTMGWKGARASGGMAGRYEAGGRREGGSRLWALGHCSRFSPQPRAESRELPFSPTPAAGRARYNSEGSAVRARGAARHVTTEMTTIVETTTTGAGEALLPPPAERWTGIGHALVLPAVALAFLVVGGVAWFAAPTSPWPDRVWMAGLVLAGARPVWRTFREALRGQL